MAKFRITLADGDVVCNGKQITFRAPAASTDIASLVIDGVEYSFIDSCGKPISGCTFGFAKDALVSVLLDTDKKTAILVNSGYGALNELIKARATKQELEDGSLQVASAEQADTVKTITGTPLKFFVGTQAQYDQLTDKSNLFAIISDDQAKQELLDAIDAINEQLESINQTLEDGEARFLIPPNELELCYIDTSAANNGIPIFISENQTLVGNISTVGTVMLLYTSNSASISSCACNVSGVLYRINVQRINANQGKVYLQKFVDSSWVNTQGTIQYRII